MTSNMRKEFDAWFKRSLAQLVRCQALTEAASFENAKPLLELAWEESRESVAIELPPIWVESPNTALGQACAQVRTADIEAIKSAGLKVANQ